MYKKVGIAGKFRLVHQAHMELLIKTSFISKHVCVFIVDLPQYKRYSSIKDLILYFNFLAKKLNIEITIHVIKKQLEGLLWDEEILSLQPDIKLMIDSKEAYGNILIKNLFLKLSCSDKISVSKIEKNLYKRDNHIFIERHFRGYLQYKIIINYVDNYDKYMKKVINILKIYYDIFDNPYDRFNFILKKHNNFNFINKVKSKVKTIDFFVVKDFNYNTKDIFKNFDNMFLLNETLISKLIDKINSYFKIYY